MHDCICKGTRRPVSCPVHGRVQPEPAADEDTVAVTRHDLFWAIYAIRTALDSMGDDRPAAFELRAVEKRLSANIPTVKPYVKGDK